ncbi:MAG: transpeptidase family protein [Roseivirga sp.]|nr:transpeptidase family protein [Roseivirga sp.]
MNIKKSILLRVRLAFLAVVVFVLAVVYRMIDVQYVDGEQWRQKAEEIGLDYKTIKATRGSIYASGNDLLATSLPFYKVAFDPSLVSNELFDKTIDSLSHLISGFYRDHSADYYEQKISKARNSGKKYMLINKRTINYQQKQMMEQWPVFNLGQMQGGVIFQKTDKRHMPFKSLARRTVGYMREDEGVGVGIERSFNDYLAGQDGEGLYQRVAGNNWKPVNASSDIKPEDGFDIHTTIDINLQDVAQNALLRALEKHKANFGSVVLMEVQTGEIKAISNLTRQKGGGYAETLNYAVAGLNDPGSTFKLASMIALLEEGKVNLEDTVDTGNGVKEFYKKKMRDESSYKGGYGKITVQQVFEKSSNVGVSMLVDSIFGDNPQRFIDAIKETGYGQLLDFQMMGEGVPYVKNTDDQSWSGLSLPWMSVGYETAVTPLQTLALYNAVANDGRMIQPIIVKSIQRANEPVKTFKTKTIQKRIASKSTLKKLRAMLEGVVERGTAKNIKNGHYSIAGKTGTAQKLINGQYMAQRYYTSFAGYFPADQPMYSAIVVIDDPKGWNSYASGVSAPVFKEIADMIYSQDLDIHKEFESTTIAEEGTFPMIRAGNFDELRQLCNELGISNHAEGEDLEWVRTRVDNNAIKWRRNHDESDLLVPNVQGMTLRDALYLLENKGLKVSITGTGRVRKQSVRPGKRIDKGKTTITIELG